MTSFHYAPDEWMEDDEAMEERSMGNQIFLSFYSDLCKNKTLNW